MNELQRAVWLLSMPLSSVYNTKMQECTGRYFTGSEQHKTTSVSRIDRDKLDAEKVISSIKDKSPYSDDASLRNIVNGVIARDDVNVQNFESVGNKILKRMEGVDMFLVKFKRSEKVVTLANISRVKVSESVHIDPALLFQRLMLVAKSNELDMNELLKYEMCACPLHLFSILLNC
jgi:hypothetical protein